MEELTILVPGNLEYTRLNSISNAFNSSNLKYHERCALKLNDPKTTPKNLLKNVKNIC